MNRSSRKQHHEQARKRHRLEQQEHARELAKKKPSMRAFWVMAIGLTLVIAFVIVAAFF